MFTDCRPSVSVPVLLVIVLAIPVVSLEACNNRPLDTHYTCDVSVAELSDACQPYGCNCSYNSSSNNGKCVVHAGSRVILRCQDDDAELFANGTSTLSHPLTIQRVGLNHSATYECRGNGTSYSRVLEVIGNAVLIGSRTCSRGVTSDVYGCCMFGDLMEVEEKFSIQFFAMGGEPVRWTYQFSLINHPPAELSATIESQSTPLLYSIRYNGDNWPINFMPPVVHVVGSDEKEGVSAVLTVTMFNNFSNNSLCFELKLIFDGNYWAKRVPPFNDEVQEGSTIVYNYCFFLDGEDISILFFKRARFYLQSEDKGIDEEYCLVDIGTDRFFCLNNAITVSQIDGGCGDSLTYLYSFKITNVSQQYDGAVIKCQVEYPGTQVQWESVATLTVHPQVTEQTTTAILPVLTPSSHSTMPTVTDTTAVRSSAILIAVITVSVLLMLLASVGIVVAAVFWLLHMRSKRGTALSSEEFPLVNSRRNVEFIFGLQVFNTKAGNFPLRRTRSIDSGIELLSEAVLVTSRPILLNQHLIRRTVSLTNISEKKQKKRVNVYISYSEDRSDWVLEYLQLLVERMIYADVTVSEDMIPGLPISDERLRLIHKADKIVIVCSLLYLNSPWSQYDLYQSVSKQPSVVAGKIIPILCDGVDTVPSVLKSVVELYESDPIFEKKLEAAIFG